MHRNNIAKQFIPLLFVIFIFVCLPAGRSFFGALDQAQALPLRSDINQANDFFRKRQYTQAESGYNKILERNPRDQRAKFNLGNALYKQGRFKDSAKIFAGLTLEVDTKELKAKSFYNLGNSYFQQEDYQGAIDSYEETLKLNPRDKDAQFNLALAKKIKAMPKKEREKQKQKRKQQKKDKGKNKKEKKEQDKGKKQDRDKQHELKKGQQRSGQMSKEDALRILNALEGREKHQAKKAKAVKGRANVKDW